MVCQRASVCAQHDLEKRLWLVAMQATHTDLCSHQQQCASETEEVRAALQALTKQKSDEILNLNNHLAQLKKQLELYQQQASIQVGCSHVQH